MVTPVLFLGVYLYVFLYFYSKIKTYHKNRNRYNTLPVGGLTHVKNNTYRDANGITWIKRSFTKSLLHNPWQYYVFETYDAGEPSSSEVTVLKTDFDNGITRFHPSSFNYYSSLRFPVRHALADVLPVFLFWHH